MQPEQEVPVLPTTTSLRQVSPIDGAARLCSLRFSVYLHCTLQENGHLEIFLKSKDIKKKTEDKFPSSDTMSGKKSDKIINQKGHINILKNTPTKFSC